MEQDIAAQVVGLGGASDFSLWSLFLRADFVVKFVIVLLIASSIFSWALIFDKFKLFKAINKSTEDFEKKFPWQLSGGMQQRASIARALAFDADILLMDEPFGALDEIVRDYLNEQLLKLWHSTEKTICFVTHSIPEAVYLSTKIVVMSPRPGRIIDIIESDLPDKRPLEIRDTKEFIDIAQRVREGLRAGHSYE